MVSLAETPLTGKPDAGNPPVRFGGRGSSKAALPTPIPFPTVSSGLEVMAVGQSPTGGGCSLLAPCPRPNWAQQTSSNLRPGPLSGSCQWASNSAVTCLPETEQKLNRVPSV